MSELIEIADLELRRDGAIAAADALGEEFKNIRELAKQPLTGKTVIAITTRLVPPLVTRVQEKVVAMECTENSWVLDNLDMSTPGGMYSEILKEIGAVVEGYGKHIECDFQKVVSAMSSDSIKAEDVLTDIARVRQLVAMWENRQNVRCDNWTDIIPLNYEEGDYLLDMTPMESFRTYLNQFIENTVCWRGGSAWTLPDLMANIKDRFHILDVLHKRVLSYIPEVPGE